jgi:uncharacterized membrane protein YeiH
MISTTTFFDGAAILACVVMAVLVSIDRHRRFGAAMVVGVIASVAGGTLRDLLLGAEPVFWIRQPWQIYFAFATTAALFGVLRKVHVKARWLAMPDALSIAIPAAIAARTALLALQPVGVACVLGLIAGMTGGILRDLVCAREPAILKRELYGSAALIGAGAVALAHGLHWAPAWELLSGTVVATTTRLLAQRYHISFGRIFLNEP